MKLLVTGAKGMLAYDILRVAGQAGHELLAIDLPELDITDAEAVQSYFAEHRPEALINCAAWTDVDGAESHEDAAHAVNATGPAVLSRAAAAHNAALLHLSTDYVFPGHPPLDGAGEPRPYVESDATGPLSVYGKTKLEGEQAVLGGSPRNTVVRSAWLFGVRGRNFVDTMLRLASEREAVQVVDDQIGSPTWTGHLAPALVGMLEREVRGLVHLAASGSVSWNGFAKEIFRQAEVECEVQPASTEQMARPAPRPAFSVLSTERSDVLPMPDWRDGLAGYLAARAGLTRA
ncbi:MAG TPA: dTDP-4-dehydrorhamnose reductase [Solirubrobacteraceae bacterium]|jgi:dTDP-4-dehydrorhamnose reductase